MKLLNKGAMFGLDARIALAIFGALSVISGAALYSAIQQSKVVALAADFKEVAKAYEAYVLDTGQDVNAGSYSADNPSLILIEKPTGVEGWNGPYISYPQSADWSDGIDHSQYDYFYISKGDMEAWNATGNPGTDNSCDGSKKCHAWVALRMGTTSSATTAMVENLDEYFDGGDGNTTGLFRYDITSNAFTYARLYIMPTLDK